MAEVYWDLEWTLLQQGFDYAYDKRLYDRLREGRTKRISPHLVRAPDGPVDDALHAFYAELLALLRRPALREGEWRLLEVAAAWQGNWTSDRLIAWTWEAASERRVLIAVNQAAYQSQGYVSIDFPEIAGRSVRLRDALGPDRYDRSGDELLERGLYLDLPAFGRHVFEVIPG